MLPVASPSQFPEDGLITFFSGKNLDEAIAKAIEWAEMNKIEVHSYYPQRAFGKSILVSYKKENENE